MILLRDVMSLHFERIGPDRPVREAVEKMNRLNLSALPVCGEDDRVVGMLSEPRFSRTLAAAASDPSDRPVRELMCSDVHTGSEDEAVVDAVARMRKNDVVLLPVLGADERLSGVFCLGGPWRRRRKN